MFSRLPLVFLVCAALGCRARLLRPSAEAGVSQEVIYKHGLPVVRSVAANSEVVLEPVAQDAGRYRFNEPMGFAVAVWNRGPTNLEFREEDVSVVASEKPVALYRASEIEDRIHDESEWSDAFNAVVGSAGADLARAAGRNARAAVERTAAKSTEVRVSDQFQLDNLATWALQRTTLQPGEFVVGGVMVNASRRLVCSPPSSPYPDADQRNRIDSPCAWVVTVRAGEDEHVFRISEAFE